MCIQNVCTHFIILFDIRIDEYSCLCACVYSIQLTNPPFLPPQVKLDEAQESEQEALRNQLTQEQELLDKFQDSQKAKLAAQHEREKQALDVKVESTERDLELEVSALFVRQEGVRSGSFETI